MEVLDRVYEGSIYKVIGETDWVYDKFQGEIT